MVAISRSFRPSLNPILPSVLKGDIKVGDSLLDITHTEGQACIKLGKNLMREKRKCLRRLGLMSGSDAVQRIRPRVFVVEVDVREEKKLVARR